MLVEVPHALRQHADEALLHQRVQLCQSLFDVAQAEQVVTAAAEHAQQQQAQHAAPLQATG
ncbi:hypothetical protein D3C72_2271760 [compost metagenome]